jgi:hypothetical protein
MTDIKILEGTGFNLDETTVKFIEIPKEHPIISFKPFPNREGNPLILNAKITSAIPNQIYSADINEIKALKENKKFDIKSFFSTHPLDTSNRPFSSVRWYYTIVWGVCFLQASGSEIVSENCLITELISVEKTDLHSMTASFMLLNRKDLSPLEIENCRRCLAKDSYGIYTHFLFSKFDRGLFEEIQKDLKTLCIIIDGISEGYIKIDDIDKKYVEKRIQGFLLNS